TRFSKSESAGCGRLFPCNTCTRDLFRWLRSDWQVFLHRLQSLALCSSDLVSSTGSPLGRLLGLAPGFVELDDAVQCLQSAPRRCNWRRLHVFVAAQEERLSLAMSALRTQATTQHALSPACTPI